MKCSKVVLQCSTRGLKLLPIPFYSVSVTASAAGWFGSLTLDVRSVRDSRSELSADEWQQNRDTPTHAGPQRTGSGNFKPEIREVQKPVQVQRDAGLGGAVSREPKENPRSSPKKVGGAGGRRGEQGQFQPGGRSKRTERAGCIHTDEQQRWAVRRGAERRAEAPQDKPSNWRAGSRAQLETAAGARSSRARDPRATITIKENQINSTLKTTTK